MHIALLRPAATETPEGRLGELLARGLPAGEIEDIRVPATPLAESQAMAELLERAGEFDLIHVLVGPVPLAFAARAPTPIVTTLRRVVDPEVLALLGRLQGHVWCVGGEREAPTGLECAAVIPTPAAGAGAREVEATVRAYVEVWGRAIAAAARERADSEHDRRPWGEYWVLADTPEYKVKRIDVLPGKRLSYQRHAQRAEHWVVVRGRAVVTLDGVEHALAPGQSIDVPLGAAHRVANPGPELLSFVEVQHGSYFGEDDIERLADDFGRSG